VVVRRGSTHAATLLLATLLAAACTTPIGEPEQSSPPDPGGGPHGSPEECPGALLEGVLLADDESGFLVRHEEGFISAVTWPDGYLVRDGQVRELVDPAGTVVASEGDFVSLGGGEIFDPRSFLVCGPFTVTQRD
jgi:hypothetical protein